MLCSIRQRGWADSAVAQRRGEHNRGVRRAIGREPADQVLQVLNRGDDGGQRHAIVAGDAVALDDLWASHNHGKYALIWRM